MTDPPRVRWERTHDGSAISASKGIVLYNAYTFTFAFGYYILSEDDRDGILVEFDGYKKLNIKDYTHWSYLCLPDWYGSPPEKSVHHGK